jgi:hypothetical protein
MIRMLGGAVCVREVLKLRKIVARRYLSSAVGLPQIRKGLAASGVRARPIQGYGFAKAGVEKADGGGVVIGG